MAAPIQISTLDFHKGQISLKLQEIKSVINHLKENNLLYANIALKPEYIYHNGPEIPWHQPVHANQGGYIIQQHENLSRWTFLLAQIAAELEIIDNNINPPPPQLVYNIGQNVLNGLEILLKNDVLNNDQNWRNIYQVLHNYINIYKQHLDVYNDMVSQLKFGKYNKKHKKSKYGQNNKYKK